MKKTIIGLRIAQIILAFIVFIFAFLAPLDNDGLFLPIYLQPVPTILCSAVIVLVFVEFFYVKTYSRILYLLFASSVSIAMCIDDGIAYLNLTLCFFAFIYVLLCLVSFIHLKRTLSKVNKKKTLPNGFYCTKDLIFLICAIICCFIPFYISIIFKLVMDISFFEIVSSFLFTVALLLGTASFYILRNKFNKVLIKFSKTGEFNQFMSECDEILKNNLHEDTIRFIKLMQVNYLFLVDKEKAYELFNTIELSSMQNGSFYHTIEVIYYINKCDYETAEKLIDNYLIKYKVKGKQLLDFQRLIEVYIKRDEIENIESKYPLNSSKVVNLIRASTLMFYFKTRNDSQKAMVYAKYIIENTSEFTELIKDANEVINENKI